MSVDIENLILSAGLDPRVVVTTPTFTGSVVFKASQVRSLGLLIGYEPIEGDAQVSPNPFHGEVWDNTPKKSFSDAQRKGLAGSASWYVELPDTDIN
jgi:hypothetical protein